MTPTLAPACSTRLLQSNVVPNEWVGRGVLLRRHGSKGVFDNGVFGIAA